MWHVGVLGFYGYGENRVTFDGWLHYNDPAPLASPHENPASLFFGDYIARNIVVRNADIQGLRIGVQAPIKAGDTGDIYGNTPGTILVENSTLKNFWNIYTTTPYGVTGGGAAIPAARDHCQECPVQQRPGRRQCGRPGPRVPAFHDKRDQSQRHGVGPGRRRKLQWQPE